MAATKRIYITARQEAALQRAVAAVTDDELVDDDDLNSLVAILSKLDIAKEHP